MQSNKMSFNIEVQHNRKKPIISIKIHGTSNGPLGLIVEFHVVMSR